MIEVTEEEAGVAEWLMILAFRTVDNNGLRNPHNLPGPVAVQMAKRIVQWKNNGCPENPHHGGPE